MPKRFDGCTELLKATDLSPADRALVLSLRSDAHASQRNVDGAIDDLKQATELQPEDAALRERLAMMLARRSDDRLSRNELLGAIDDLSEAIKFARDATPLRARFARLYEAQGLQLDESGDRKGAIEAYSKAIEFDAKRAELHALRGRARVATDDNGGASKDFTEALAIQPDSVEFLVLRGEALLKAGETTKAILDFNRIIELDPKNTAAHLLRGNAFETAGPDKRSEARAAYEAALAIDPTNGIAKRAIARLDSATAVVAEPTEVSIELARDIQTQLKRLGCYSGDIDGKWGRASQSALNQAGRHISASTDRLSEDVLTALAAVEEVACESAVSAPSGDSKHWNHNGSIMILSAEGKRRRFYYREPRSGLRAQGVSKGTLLFDGSRDGSQYSGTAYIFSKRCGKRAYSVSGFVSDDDKSVTMSGPAPRLDSSCRQAGTRDDLLIFSLIEADIGGSGVADKCSQDDFYNCFVALGGWDGDTLGYMDRCRAQHCGGCRGSSKETCGMVE